MADGPPISTNLLAPQGALKVVVCYHSGHGGVFRILVSLARCIILTQGSTRISYITWTQQNYAKTPRRLSLNINDTTMIWLQEGKGKFHSFQKCYLFLFVKSVGNISSTFSFWQFILYSGPSFFGKRRQFNR